MYDPDPIEPVTPGVVDQDNGVPANTKTPEPKVVAATTGAGAGVVIANLILWFADTVLFTPHVEGDLPGAVTMAVNLAVPAALAFLAGYAARHQYRDLPPDPANA